MQEKPTIWHTAMHIITIGLNHNVAPVQLRERLYFTEDQIRASLARLSCGKASFPLSEMVILSTCNRIEIYSVSNTLSFDELEVFLSETRDVPVDELRSYLYYLRECFLSGRVRLENDQIHPNLPDRPQVYRMAADRGLLSEQAHGTPT